MKKLLDDILKGLDGETYDISKVLWVIGVLVYLGLSITAAVMNQPWNPAQYGIGFGAVLAGGGAAVKLNNPTSSQNINNQQSS